MARWQMIDFVGKRRIWFTIAGVLIAVSIGSLIFKGLNLGIDFRGGTQMTFVTEQPVDIADVRAEAAKFELGDAVIQGRGDEVDGGFREFQIKSEPLTAAEQRQVVTRDGDRVRRAARPSGTSPRASAGRSCAARSSRSSSRSC